MLIVHQSPRLMDAPDYNNVQELQYLDMVISETLRMYPPGFRMDIRATIEIPASYIHYDPEYWPAPEKFIPERFTTEAKSQRHPLTYLPFGAGSRSCIAMRLALLEAKIAMIRSVQKFTFQTGQETKIPLELKSNSTLGPRNGFIIKTAQRT
ncbi:thromboxane-A synthase [Acipenser oxyrinchus oxyrinchus]|uniref:Thromboxane-A synthase n=1 Tax=Acipenser oxyrinchus oxyrinchus TaxID=40147 RepID=A0AAD8DJ23_ACIOX|nr:thromboxane-A synthase [Acipenser oxyrinchus oxyrinchus]